MKAGSKDMFYLTTHVFIYGVRHMVKDHSDSEKGNPNERSPERSPGHDSQWVSVISASGKE